MLRPACRWLTIVLGLTLATASQAAGVRAVTVADGIKMGWAFAFLPDGSMLVNDRASCGISTETARSANR